MSIVNRVSFLRKYIEHNLHEAGADIAYNILSSLIYGKQKPNKLEVNSKPIELTSDEIKEGELFIKKFIVDFDYDTVLQNFSKEVLLNLYGDTQNDYLKIQIFRIYYRAIMKKNTDLPDDILKYMDEIFHVENDYLYCLNFLDFNTVPLHIVKECNKIILSESNKNLSK